MQHPEIQEFGALTQAPQETLAGILHTSPATRFQLEVKYLKRFRELSELSKEEKVVFEKA